MTKMTPAKATARRMLRAVAPIAALIVVTLLVALPPAASAGPGALPRVPRNAAWDVPIEDISKLGDPKPGLLVKSFGTLSPVPYLDEAAKYGQKVLVYFSGTVNVSKGTVAPTSVAGLVAKVKSHPALYGYLSVKEPSWSGISLSEMRSLYNAYRAADAHHPVVALLGDVPHFGTSQNQWGSGVANVLWVDWYPVTYSRGYIATASTHFPKVRSYVASKTPGTPIWLMVQGHGYRPGDRRTPTSAELVREVNDGTTYLGAAGIAFYVWDHAAYDSDFSRNPKLWATARSLMVSNYGTVVVPSR
jgi:hypothetical protein